MANQNAPNIQNCGIYTGAGGNVTAKKIKITIIPPHSSGPSTNTRKPPFRYNTPTPTRHFKGRRKTMEDVRDYFANLPPRTVDCWERIVAIVGLGGMGKTETAYKFAAEFKDTFVNVAWINAETENSALKSFRGLANRFGVNLNDRECSDLDIVKEVYCHIDQEDYGSVLFIFDNAIRLNSDEEEFGILEFLPTDDLPNQRFPYVLITTQTHDWERRIQTFQVEELSEAESLEFFHSCFQIESAECDELFNKLHKLLDGYPLVMNLAASQLDYNPKRHSVQQLKQQIQNYVDKLEQENKKILHEKMNRAWPTKYSKTLSTVWQLAFEILEQENNGRDALKLLQFMSFLHVPLESEDVVKMLVRSSDCPHQGKDVEFQLKESFRVLERFYIVRILDEDQDDEDGFTCDLGMHRLVQLVVRQQKDCSTLLETVLFYLASDYEQTESVVSASALDEVLHTSQLSQRVLPYVGLLACWGVPAACKFVETRQPETKAAAAIWRLYYLERGITTLNENAITFIQEFIELTKSEENLEDRKFFADIAIKLLAYDYYLGHERVDGTEVPGYFRLETLDGVEELIPELISNVFSLFHSSCKYAICRKDGKTRDKGLSHLTAKLSKTFIHVVAPKSRLTADVIAETWFAIFARLSYYDGDKELQPDFWVKFWKKIFEIFQSPDASQATIAALRACMWNRGLAKELIRVLGFISRRFPHVDEYWQPFLLRLLDVCMDGMDLRDVRAQEVILALSQTTGTIETEYISKGYSVLPRNWIYWAVELSSVWIKLLLVDGDPPSHELLECLLRLKFLDWIERVEYTQKQFNYIRWNLIPDKYFLEYFPLFIQRFSSSDILQIKVLVNVCGRLIEQKSEGPMEKYILIRQ